MARIGVRNPTSAEVEAAAEVAAQAFPHLSLEHWQKSFSTVADMFGLEYILVAEMDKRIVSSLLCSPAPIHIGDGHVSHSAVGAVGTLPECREKGCAGEMMTEVVKLFRKLDIHTSSLWPFSYEYYRKFGWEVGAEGRVYEAEASVFAELGNPHAVRPAGSGDFDGIVDLYISHAPYFSCTTDRTEEWWERVINIDDYLQPTVSSGKGAVAIDHGEELEAYAVYEVQERDDKKVVDIKELVYFSIEQRRNILSALAAKNPESRITFRTPSADSLLHELPNPRAVKAAIVPTFQFRIIDPERAISSLSVDEALEGKLTFSIDDPIFKHGFEFGVEFEEGELLPCRPDKKHVLRMNVQTLAKLYTGYITPAEAIDLGALRISGNEAMTFALATLMFPSNLPYRSWLEPG